MIYKISLVVMTIAFLFLCVVVYTIYIDNTENKRNKMFSHKLLKSIELRNKLVFELPIHDSEKIPSAYDIASSDEPLDLDYWLDKIKHE